MTIEKLLNLLNNDNQTNSKKTCHLSNDILIRMCENLDNSQEITTELSRSKKMVNRGSTFESLFKMTLNKTFNLNLNTNKNAYDKADLDANTLGVTLCKELGLPMQELEIKFSTSFANGSEIKNPLISAVLVANSKGIYLGNVKDLNLDNKGKIKPLQPKFKKLEKLSQIMGY